MELLREGGLAEKGYEQPGGAPSNHQNHDLSPRENNNAVANYPLAYHQSMGTEGDGGYHQQHQHPAEAGGVGAPPAKPEDGYNPGVVPAGVKEDVYVTGGEVAPPHSDYHQQQQQQPQPPPPKEHTKPVVTKRPSKKKPKDKPKRPLSAYNFFFKEEREKILKVILSVSGEDDSSKGAGAEKNDPKSDDYLDEAALSRLRKEGGKVSFEEMGKIIGQRWKNIDPDRLGKYSVLAAEDTERYKKEMQSYNGRQEAKMRSEAMKPPTLSSAYPRADMMLQQGGGAGKGGGSCGVSAADMSRSAGGGAYADPSGMMGSAYGNAMNAAYSAAYGGMDFNTYQQAMSMQGASMYGPYGGYGAAGGGMGPSPAAQGAGNPEIMSQQQQMGGGQYGGGGRGDGSSMYGMMGGGAGGYQGGGAGGMMGYGGEYAQQGMDPSMQGGMYGGYGGSQGWGQQ